jgi:polyhydroxybutyrate depolymerase
MGKVRFMFLLLAWWCAKAGTLHAQVPGSFTFEGIDRTYTVFVPGSYVPGDHLPLLLALHGLTQTGNIMMLFSDFNAYADQYGFVVVYPDGVNNSWNVGFPGGSTANDVGFLSALIDTIHAHYGIDLNRVYSTGFSNGGFMSYRLACELTDRIAAIASVAGTMTDGSYGSCQPSRNIAVMHVHGTSDLIVPYNGGFGNTSADEVLSLWRDFGNCPDTAVIVDLPDLVQEGSTVQVHTWAPCDDSVEVVHYKVINGGHTWPGSVGNVGFGITNRDISASDEIWKFVSRFSLNLPTGIEHKIFTAFRYYPNPAASGMLTIEYEKRNVSAALVILSIEGDEVLSAELPAGSRQQEIDLSILKPGFYILKVFSETAGFTGKLIVE